MPFLNGIFKRGYSWVADRAAGIKIDPARLDADANDMALGLSNCLLRDGTGGPTADISWAGRAITSLKAPANTGDAMSLGTTPASEVTRALGFTPTINYSAATHTIGFAWDGASLRPDIDGNGALGVLWGETNLTASQLNAIAGQTLYGTANLNAGQIGAILGYAPAQPTSVAEALAGGQNDLSVNARTYLVGATFVATASNFAGFGRTAFLNNTAGAAGYAAYLGLDLVDVSTGNVVASGVEMPASATYGQGWVQAVAFLAAGNLAIGHTYQLRAYNYKTSTGAVIATSATEIIAECF